MGAGAIDGAPDGHTALVESRFARFATGPGRDLALPGSGATGARWRALAALAEQDLALGRLAEGHADALAIIAEVDPGAARVPPGSRWGVWAAEPPGSRLTATPRDGTWILDGVRRYCSGALMCTHALVTADTADGSRLFRIDLDHVGYRPRPDSWPAVGMAASQTLDVELDAVPGRPLGAVGAYLDRPGFHHGGAGVAACWFGGARAVARPLTAAARAGRLDAHGLAHLGTVDLALHTAAQALRTAATEIDADPADRSGTAEVRALRVRALVERTCADVLEHVGRALGAEPLCHDAGHARAVADLTVYIRQHHAERDLARLGALLAAAPPEPERVGTERTGPERTETGGTETGGTGTERTKAATR
ncbi:acyl-CoA dehydrogenase [Embleya sp. NPDC008237]|uniref:acyl-CoA dehydrogenase n=1 Tax=Embleya sp. NPDC008237 TaxID=3363978 RepID=UPI0036E4A1CC